MQYCICQGEKRGCFSSDETKGYICIVQAIEIDQGILNFHQVSEQCDKLVAFEMPCSQNLFRDSPSTLVAS